MSSEAIAPLDPLAAVAPHARPATADPVQRMARAGALSLVGAAVSSVAGVAFTAAVTNGLSRTAAGTVFSLTSLFLVVTSITQLGTDVGLVRSVPTLIVQRRPRAVRPVIRAALTPVLAVSMLAGLLGVVFAQQLADEIADGSAGAATMVRILAVTLPIASVYGVLMAATRGLRTMKPTVAVDAIGRTVGQLVAVVLVLLLGWGGSVVVVAWSLPYVAILCVGAVWLVRLLRRLEARTSALDDPTIAVVVDRQALRTDRADFWRFTGPRAFANIAQMALKRLDIVLVSALRSPAEAALYAAATRFVVMGQLGVQSLQQALSPQLSALFAAKDDQGVRDVYRAATAWTMMLSWPIYLASVVLAPEILKVFGDGYTEVAPVVVMLSLAMLAATASGAVDSVLLMSGHTWMSLFNNLFAVGVNVGLNLLLIPDHGAIGAGVSWTVAIVLRNLLPLVQIACIHRISPVSRQTGMVALTAASCFGLVPGLARLLGAPLPLVLGLLVAGGLVYAGSVYLARRSLHLDTLLGMLKGRARRGDDPLPGTEL